MKRTLIFILLVSASLSFASVSCAGQPTIERIVLLAWMGDPGALMKLRKAAEKGDAEAQDALGGLHTPGGPLPTDYLKAVKWFRKSALNGYVGGQKDLADSYWFGHGVPQDYARAFFWYHQAATQGNADAQSMLGYQYATGQGVPQDYVGAFIWFSKAAEQGNPDAQFELGAAYYRGEGVPQDYTLAVAWYRKAAEQAYPQAQGALGAMYMQGDGVPQNYIEAYKWFNLSKAFAKSNGKLYKNLEMLINDLSTRMTKEQVAQAQTEATDWFDKYNKNKAAEAKKQDELLSKKNEITSLSQVAPPPGWVKGNASVPAHKTAHKGMSDDNSAPNK